MTQENPRSTLRDDPGFIAIDKFVMMTVPEREAKLGPGQEYWQVCEYCGPAIRRGDSVSRPIKLVGVVAG